MNVIVRPCFPRDLPEIMRLIKDISIIYSVPLEKLRTNVEELKDAGFGTRPQYECFVAEVPPEQRSKEGHTLIGYALSTYTYNTWRGRNLYMDNFYVMPEFRGRRIGRQLLNRVAEVAWGRGCTQLRMHVSSQKPENIAFLLRRGGEDLTTKEGWTLFRFHRDTLWKMAAQSKF
ncbi:Diamine acetyltransferase 1 [Varanus komodoensis]|uniref:N-acetyltransferase domain-containing protein n=1 Tax=Varanus komodoensis TaxID=61221 RepID=A0A8D2LDA3_VARKO|nr:diamine acetyltransferase 1-like [Varanus komodoensis]KAF7236799.1 Diamine acetyltransferase 1 [Varanus komodoensis]